MPAHRDQGKVITARGPVEPTALGAVMMHEHMHSDSYDWQTMRMVVEERLPTAARRQFLLDHAVPLLKQCHAHGMHGYVEVTPAPWRAHATLYREIAELSDCHIVVCTGFYREMELGKYWVKTEADAIWPFVRDASEAELAEFCIRDLTEGMHGTTIRAGAIKIGTSQAPMTDLEKKCFRAAARAQQATGVHITTHCTMLGAETSQLATLADAGVDLRRVVIGHTAAHLMDKAMRRTCLEWMKRGANFLPTNLGVKPWLGERWRPLVEAIHEAFDAGHGDKLTLGLDSGFASEGGEFARVGYLPPEPWTHLFTNTLPALRAMGLTPEEEKTMLETNPQRILPIH